MLPAISAPTIAGHCDSTADPSLTPPSIHDCLNVLSRELLPNQVGNMDAVG